MLISFKLPSWWSALFPFDSRGIAKLFLEKHYPTHDFSKWIELYEHNISEFNMESSAINDSIVKKFFKIA